MAKKRGKSGNTRNSQSRGNRIAIAWKNFLLFLVLFLVSFMLYNISTSALFLNLFGLLSILFAFISFALLIVLIVFLILKRK